MAVVVVGNRNGGRLATSVKSGRVTTHSSVVVLLLNNDVIMVLITDIVEYSSKSVEKADASVSQGTIRVA